MVFSIPKVNVSPVIENSWENPDCWKQIREKEKMRDDEHFVKLENISGRITNSRTRTKGLSCFFTGAPMAKFTVHTLGEVAEDRHGFV